MARLPLMRGICIAIFLAGCDPDKPDADAQAPDSVEATPPQSTTPKTSPPRSTGSDWTSSADIERLAERVYWIGTDTVVELAFELGSGAWRPTVSENGATLPALDDSVLTRLGLQEGDRIFEAAGEPATNVDSLRRAFEAVRDGKRRFLVRFDRSGNTHALTLRFRGPSKKSLHHKFDQGIDVLSQGVTGLEDGTRQVDKEVLNLLAEMNLRSGLELLGPPSAGDLFMIGGQPVVGTEGLASALEAVATRDSFEIETRDGRVLKFEVTQNLIGKADLQIARDLMRSPAGRANVSGTSNSGDTPAPILHIEEVGSNIFEISRSDVDALLANPASLAKAARIIPSQKDGETVGFKLYGMRPPSESRPFSLKSLGFENGDLVKSVNGKPLDSPERAIEAFARVRDEDEFRFDIDRRGTPMTIEIRIKD